LVGATTGWYSRHNVLLPGASHQIAQLDVIPVDLIASYPFHRHASRPGVRQHLCSQLHLGLEGHFVRHARFPPPLLILAPLLGQVQPAIQKGIPAGCAVRQKDPHLAVLNLARRAAVLPFDTDRLGALLQEASFVDNANPVCRPEALHDKHLQFISHGVGIPLGPKQQPLQRLWVAGPGRFGHLPAVLALHQRQQPAKILAGRFTGLAAGKEACKSGVERPKLGSVLIDFSRMHRPHLLSRC
jgi:hypothetical protein